MKLAILSSAASRRAPAGSLADGTINILGKDVDLPLLIVGTLIAFVIVDRALNR